LAQLCPFNFIKREEIFSFVHYVTFNKFGAFVALTVIPLKREFGKDLKIHNFQTSQLQICNMQFAKG
jgi:hypothetical protein